MDVAISIVVTFLLTLVNGYFSASEMAVVNAKRAVLEPEADEGDKRAKSALDLSSDSGQFLATIQVAITLVGFASSAFAATSLSDPLGSWFVSLVRDHVLELLLGDVLTLVGGLDAHDLGEAIGRLGGEPDQRGRDVHERADGTSDGLGDALGVGESDALGNQLAHHRGEVGHDERDDDGRERGGNARGHAEAHEPGAERARMNDYACGPTRPDRGRV